MKKHDAIIIDIDGTLANITKRREVLAKTNDWDIFNTNVDDDLLNSWCSEIINKFRESYKVLLITGRNEKQKDKTVDWLNKHNVFYDSIFFRPNDDFRKDAVVKEEIYFKNIKNENSILFVVDDRQSVVEMWRKNGLVCLQCDVGNF